MTKLGGSLVAVEAPASAETRSRRSQAFLSTEEGRANKRGNPASKIVATGGPDLGIGEVKPVVEEAAASSGHRDTLVGLSQSGLLQKIGIRKTESQVVSMTDSEVEKTFSEYQRRYTACVADDVVNNILYGYAAFCHWLFPATAKDRLAR